MTDETNPSTVVYFKGFGIVTSLLFDEAAGAGAQHVLAVHPVAGVIIVSPVPQTALHDPDFPALTPVPVHAVCADTL